MLLKRIFSAQLMNVTGKFQLLIGRLSQLTNGKLEFSSHSYESRTKKYQCKRTFNSKMANR